jgi:3-phosphoshikimate 1-carboxyvinyltransferase
LAACASAVNSGVGAESTEDSHDILMLGQRKTCGIGKVSHTTNASMKASRGQPCKGRVRVPGDKSISHRALILGAFAVGTTRVRGLLEGQDVLNTAKAMRILGASVERTGAGTWQLDGVGVGGFAEPSIPLDFGNSGTGCRLVIGAVAGCPITATFDGDASLRKRPMNRVLDPLVRMGARPLSVGEGGRLPLTLQGARDAIPIVYEPPVVEPWGSHGCRVTLTGQPELGPADIAVPADPSSAAFPLTAALITSGSDVIIDGVMMNPLRTGLFKTLREMGATIELLDVRDEGGEEIADVRVRSTGLIGVDVPAPRAPTMIDEYPVLAVAAAFAQGTTTMRGLKELRVKESDRLAATADMLRVNGVEVDISGDDLVVHGRGHVPGGGTVATHMDHRIAMAALVMGLASEKPVTVDDVGFIATSFPGFADLMRSLGADLV